MRGPVTDLLTPVLTANWADERAWKLSNYERRGGYDALRSALQMDPAEVVTLVKDLAYAAAAGQVSRPG